MKIIKPTKIGIAQAVAILKQGGTIVYPTDTAYALGGIFDSPKVIANILKIKKRSDRKFTVIACNMAQVNKFFKLNANQKKLAAKYWPGPLSIAVSKKYAVRVPNHKIAVILAKNAGKPLIATSANISGQSTLYSGKNIIKQFKNKKNQPDLLLDFGRLLKTKTSTIVEAFHDSIKIIRAGSTKISED